MNVAGIALDITSTGIDAEMQYCNGHRQ
jgi:hypothetical protein